MAVVAGIPMAESVAGAVIMGLIIGIIELVFVHSDEAGTNWLAHGLHALPVAMLFVFVSMHVEWVFNLIGHPALETMQTEIIARAVIGLIATVKVKGAAAIVGRIGEKWPHAFIIGALIAVSPYIWNVISPAVMAVLPFA